ncbi:MAG: hypothetical protein A3J63_00605 [Candidatus Moranbacteria bacterium RIFCSPHIGHO2_02_FULL_40_12b]|nr:MAG: hypothetical protein A3J63_00605 [Candidatus Moranbacteria bacterium RIFCSPHIGHO2_02_FULL_40_12b]OGI23718.1 MAG: hypothetical protein A3E91_02530 [Candidatus Moranbacteria bacterium RIFCSPHIGHO2_12_FULL_40_10]
MKNKILLNAKRAVVVAVTAASLLAPAVALGQWTTALPATSNLATTSVAVIISTVMQWLLYIIGTIAVITFIIAGIMYLTAAGDEDQIGKAKKAMVYGIVGIAVALIGLIIVNVVDTMLRGTVQK